MSTYQFINLHPLSTEEEEALALLKKEFNEMATTYNTAWPRLSTEERNELIDRLAVLEWQIYDHVSRNRSHPKK